nr:2-dehydro-3-deoxyphosphooctonate aldolase [uncultured Flavobacterium sp.]
MFKKILLLHLLVLSFTSCISTKSTIKNIDNKAIKPVIKDNAYILTEYADSKKYGYNQDYPINIGVVQPVNENKYITYFFNGIEGPNGEKISFEKVDTCCPFPTKNDKMGGGLLNIYEVKWDGLSKPIKLYFNVYERGKIMCPIGLSIKKSAAKTQ